MEAQEVAKYVLFQGEHQVETQESYLNFSHLILYEFV